MGPKNSVVVIQNHNHDPGMGRIRSRAGTPLQDFRNWKEEIWVPWKVAEKEGNGQNGKGAEGRGGRPGKVAQGILVEETRSESKRAKPSNTSRLGFFSDGRWRGRGRSRTGPRGSRLSSISFVSFYSVHFGLSRYCYNGLFHLSFCSFWFVSVLLQRSLSPYFLFQGVRGASVGDLQK